MQKKKGAAYEKRMVGTFRASLAVTQGVCEYLQKKEAGMIPIGIQN